MIIDIGIVISIVVVIATIILYCLSLLGIKNARKKVDKIYEEVKRQHFDDFD